MIERVITAKIVHVLIDLAGHRVECDLSATFLLITNVFVLYLCVEPGVQSRASLLRLDDGLLILLSVLECSTQSFAWLFLVRGAITVELESLVFLVAIRLTLSIVLLVVEHVVQLVDAFDTRVTCIGRDCRLLVLGLRLGVNFHNLIAGHPVFAALFFVIYSFH